jgi:outer membrane protein assembly factor BamB
MDASPVLLSDRTIFAGGYGGGRLFSGQLVALSPYGEVLEGFPIYTGPILASPVVVDDVVIAGVTGARRTRNEVLAVNKNADIIWNTELTGDVDGSRWYSVSSLAVDCYNVFVANNCEDYFPETGPAVLSSSIVQLDPVTGQVLFEMEMPTESIVVGSPVIDATELGANVIVATQNGHVISLNPYADEDKLNYDLALGENSEAVGSPVIGDNGMLYFDTKGGKLYAVQTGANGLSSDAPWPTFRHDIRNTGYSDWTPVRSNWALLNEFTNNSTVFSKRKKCDKNLDANPVRSVAPR